MKHKSERVNTRIAHNKKLLLEQLRKTPILQFACEKSNVSRATVYRWRTEDKSFATAMDEALHDGKMVVNDLAEAQLMTAIRERNLTAILYWLRHHHPDYANTLQIKHAIQDETLTPEQEALVREALRLASTSQTEIINPINHKEFNEPQKPNSTGTSGDDDKRPESTDSDH
jgi:hypothetical protein